MVKSKNGFATSEDKTAEVLTKICEYGSTGKNVVIISSLKSNVLENKIYSKAKETNLTLNGTFKSLSMQKDIESDTLVGLLINVVGNDVDVVIIDSENDVNDFCFVAGLNFDVYLYYVEKSDIKSKGTLLSWLKNKVSKK